MPAGQPTTIKNGDIKGNFEIISVIGYDNSVSATRVFAKCVCGSVKSYLLNHIKSGHTKSCGCLNRKVKDGVAKCTKCKKDKPVADFYKITGGRYYSCKCKECVRNKFRVKKNREPIKRGRDHHSFVDLEGRTFGSFKVLNYVLLESTQKWVWRCICDCGIIEYVKGRDLIGGIKRISCKKCGYIRMGLGNKLANFMSDKNKVYGYYKKGAKNRGHSFELTFDQFWDIALKDCYYCGTPPSNYISDSDRNFKRNGVDRMVNNKPYDLSNAVPCCARCNIAKMDMDDQEFFVMVRQCYNNMIKNSKYCAT